MIKDKKLKKTNNYFNGAIKRDNYFTYKGLQPLVIKH